MNNCIIIGRLTRDPELKHTRDGIAYCRFTVAVDRYSKNGDNDADFIRCVVWRNQAEACAKYLSKGKMVGVSGRLQISSYEDRDGIRRKSAEIVAYSVKFLSPKSDDASADTSARSSEAQQQSSSNKQDDDVFEELGFNDDDIPF